MEDQVELARRISHSLSDISNQQSRGQSMYVNRKKRSVKWVHESSGQGKAFKIMYTPTYNLIDKNKRKCKQYQTYTRTNAIKAH